MTRAPCQIQRVSILTCARIWRAGKHKCAHQARSYLAMPLQVAQIFMPILNKSPLANFTASKFGSLFGQGLVFLQNAASGLA